MPSHASPSQSASQPNGVPSYHHGYNVSFDASGQQSFSQPAPSPYAQSFPNGPVSNPGYARSFGSQSMRGGMRGYNEEPQIYTVRMRCGTAAEWLNTALTPAEGCLLRCLSV